MKTWALKRSALAAVSLFALGAVAPASAADLPPYAKAPVAPVLGYDWTGVYGGINGGFGLAHSCWSITGVAGIAVDPPVGEGCHNASGGTVGGQVGYRWQKAHWVLGVEGQGNWSDFKGSNVSLVLAPLNNRTKIDTFGLITGQLGYERSGLERIMSTWALFEAMRAAVGDDERRQEELGALEAAARVARLLVFRAAAVADSGRPPDHEAAMAKVFATDIEQKMVEVASQWAGRAARTGEAFGGHLLPAWLIAPSFSIRGGTNEVLRGIIARRGLGL